MTQITVPVYFGPDFENVGSIQIDERVAVALVDSALSFSVSTEASVDDNILKSLTFLVKEAIQAPSLEDLTDRYSESQNSSEAARSLYERFTHRKVQ